MTKAFNTFKLGKRQITLAVVLGEDTLKVGYSVCMEGDEFNEELGRKIAEGRALSKNNLTHQYVGKQGVRYTLDNYGVLKSISEVWKNKIKATPERYIKGIR